MKILLFLTIVILAFVTIFSVFLQVVYAEDQNIGVAQKDGFELTLITDKKEYGEGELVEISFVLKNILNQNNTYSDTPCGLRISVDGYSFFDLVLIRRNSDGNFTGEKYVQEQFYCVQVEKEFTLSPNESREGKLLWTQEVSRNGEPYERIEAGTYNISYTAFRGFTSTVPVKIIEHLSPRQQITNGVTPENVFCKEGLQLIFKSKDNSPACVKPETAEKLVERGWGSVSMTKISKPSAENEIFQSRSRDIEIFQFLSRNVWMDSGCLPSQGPFAPTCTKLEFRKNGEYSWISVSDYTERSDTGRWNFALNSQDTGLIYFDNGSVIPFMKPSDDLIFKYGKFMPSDEIKYSSEELKSDHTSLSKINPSDTYLRLIKNSWKKTNDFDLAMSPDLLIFYNNGRFLASYRSNQCNHQGSWGLDGSTLVLISEPNNCDLRGGSPNIVFFDEVPILENDLLIFFGSSYYNPEDNIGKKMFTFDSYAKSVRVKGEYSGDFIKNSPTTIELTFQNVDDIDKELGEFKIELLTCGPYEPNTGCSDTIQNFVVTKDYTGILLHPSESYHDTITIIPAVSGNNDISFTLNFKDKRQSYRASIDYIAVID